MIIIIIIITIIIIIIILLSNPLDVAKTRLMNMKGNVYKGTMDCIQKTVTAEGPLALYKVRERERERERLNTHDLKPSLKSFF